MLKSGCLSTRHNLKVNILNKIARVLKSKSAFAVLCLVFLTLTMLYINSSTQVKGSVSDTFYSVIWDDAKKILVKSTSLEPIEILAQNNIKTYPEDVVSTDIILDPVTDGGIGQKIIIKRAPVFYVSVDDTIKEVRIWDSSVAEIIKKSAVVLGPKDQIKPPQEIVVTPGTIIIITRVKEADIDVYEDINFNVISKGSTSVAFGQKQIIQEGKKGQLKKTYHVTYQNGVEVSRWLSGSVVTVPKQDKIIANGIITGRANFGYYSGMVTSFFRGMTGHHLLVTNLSNGKQVTVKIIGSGPFNGPILDMGTKPFQAIGGKLSDGYISSVSVQLLD